MRINETFTQLVEGKHPKSFLEQNPGQLQALVQKFAKMPAAHVEQQVRYRLRMHEPSAPNAAIMKVVRKARGMHRELQAAEKAKQQTKKAKK